MPMVTHPNKTKPKCASGCLKNSVKIREQPYESKKVAVKNPRYFD